MRLRSFHTSLIDDYENGKIFEYDMNLPWGALTPIILQKKNYISVFPKNQQRALQHQRNVIKFFVHETFFYVRSKSQRAFFLSFCEYHTVCVQASVWSQRPFSWAFCKYHTVWMGESVCVIASVWSQRVFSAWASVTFGLFAWSKVHAIKR